jgi:hypothetical protein
MIYKSKQRSKYRVGDTVIVMRAGFVHHPGKVIATRNSQMVHRPDRDFMTITEPGVDVVPFCSITKEPMYDRSYLSVHDDQVCRLSEYQGDKEDLAPFRQPYEKTDPETQADPEPDFEQPSPITQEATMLTKPGPYDAPEGSVPQTYQVTITTVVPSVNTDPSEWDLSVLLEFLHEHYWAKVKAVPMVPAEVK